MNATLPLRIDMRASAAPLWPYAKRLGPLALIVALHVSFFYALENGLLRQPVPPSTPNEVVVHLIEAELAPVPEPVQPPPKPQPPQPQPVIKKPLPKPKPVATPTPVNPTPSEQAITVPAEPQPAAAEPFVAAAPQEAAPGPVAATPPRPKTITSGVQYLVPPKPEYPLLSRRKGEEGKVVLRVLINLKGRVEETEIKTSSGFPRLDEEARQAVLRAVFKPEIENGQPVMVYTNVPFTFKLDR